MWLYCDQVTACDPHSNCRPFSLHRWHVDFITKFLKVSVSPEDGYKEGPNLSVSIRKQLFRFLLHHPMTEDLWDLNSSSKDLVSDRSVHAHTCTHVHTHAHTHACIHTHTHKHTHTHTHTRTHTSIRISQCSPAPHTVAAVLVSLAQRSCGLIGLVSYKEPEEE